MNIITLIKLLFCLLIPAGVVLAQADPPPVAAVAAQANPFTNTNKFLYKAIQKILLSSAENVPEEHYSFKPTEAVRSYGQIVAHVADSQYAFCSVILGEKNPGLNIEKTKTSKADLIVALKDAFSYCDKAYDSSTDASAAQTVKFMGGDTPKLSVMTINQMHTMEHYGNLVTYMRMKNIVPPTSDPDFMKQIRR
ncbi:MAG TPA: DinB family protein [Thermoanaerobaculia bacterium]|nr:DinB family protein [Thermoanaerobaculia bacterium]